MQNKILCMLSDAHDIVSLGQAAPTLHLLSEDRVLWKKLCSFHFSDKQVRPHWKILDFKLNSYVNNYYTRG